MTRWAGLPETWAERGGGIPHWGSPPSNQSKFYGLSQQNYDDISKGYADANIARVPELPINSYGYGPQAQYPADQIGDGNGLGVGDWRFALAGVDPSNPLQPAPPLRTESKPAPRLVRVNSNPSPAVPFVRPDHRNSFDNRFGNWTSSPESISPRNPNLPGPPQEPGAPRGIFGGEPMPLWTTPIPLGGLLDNSNASGNGNWFTSLGGVLWDGKKPRASAIDSGVPVTPIAPPSDNSNFSGGLQGRIAALAGIDPQNPNQFALPPLDDELRGFYRDDPVQPWILQRRR